MVAFTVSFVLWAALHSVTAAPRFKSWMRKMMGDRAYEGLYRLLYNLVSGVTLLPVLYLLATRVPNSRLWAIPSPFNYLANLIQVGGLLGLLIALRQTDFWDFAGLRQAIPYLTGQPEFSSSPKLVTSGMYAWVRHPLYFFSLLIIWFTPVMTLSTFIFNVLTTLYFWVGSRYEERRLLTFFGDAYRQYRQNVPSLIPLKLTR